jgi:uncharacterized protein (TIGR00369 family)
MSAHADPALDGWKPRTLPGFAGLVGPLWTRREGDAWAYALLVDARHLNPAGVAHGGVLSTLADHAMSAVAWEANERRACVTVALDVRFLAPAAAGDLVIARARVVRQTGSLAFMDCTLTAAGVAVVAATAILSVRKPA